MSYNKKKNTSRGIVSSRARTRQTLKDAGLKREPEVGLGSKRADIGKNSISLEGTALISGESISVGGLVLKEHPGSETEVDFSAIERSNNNKIAYYFARNYASGISDPEVDRLAMQKLSYQELLNASQKGVEGLNGNIRSDSFGKEK